MINDLLKFVPLFAGFTDSEKEKFAQGFSTGEATNNSALFKAGERSEALYMIGQGFVNLTTESGQNLATLGPGSILGDTTLFRNTTHDVSAVACSDLEFWKLTDQTLRALILEEPAIGIKLSQNFGAMLAQMEDYLVQRLARTPELGTLPPHTLKAVAQCLEPEAVKSGQFLYRVGETPLGLYIIESGTIDLQPDSNDPGAESQRLQPGALMGALSLLTNKAHAHSAEAVTDALVWRMPADKFQSVNTAHPGLRRSLGRTVRARLNKADQARAVTRLAQMPLFKEAPPQAMQAIAQRMILQHAPAGERVYMVGEAGDAFYLIESGQVELTAENASGIVEELARVDEAGFFGEMSLLTGQIRTEDATATRNTNLWVLYKADLDELSVQFPAVGKALSQGLAARLSSVPEEYDEARFRRFQLLADLGDVELQQIAQRLRPTRYRMGEQIYRASSPAEMLFLLEKGQVRVQPLGGGSWLVGPGESFGERALLTNQPHNASVVAESDVDVWTLSKQDFDVLMNQYPTLAISMSRILSQRLEEGTVATQGTGYDDYAPTAATTTAPRRRRAATVDDGPEPRQRASFGEWFSNLSGFGKLRFALLILLLIWLLGIAAPAALLNLIRGESLAGASPLSISANALRAVYAVGSYELAALDQDSALAVALADSQIQPTPTYTPPPTQTPIPTNTPLPTNTPTVTPRPTATATRYIAPQYAAPAPPTATAEVVEEVKVAAVAERARAWDPRLDRLGIGIEEAPATSGQQYWRLVEGRWWNEQESGGKHHIYVEVLDENGNRITGHPVTVWWGSDSYTGRTEDKAPPEYGFNYQMYAAGNAYQVKVEGYPSDILHGLGMGDLERRDWGIHTSFLLTYRLSTRP
ncbi:MAG: cyclic nucleotide-binding domain-containing protein [Caldilineaceae bacterium]|nr:cyclic nucleotide-binding domain-containing protein [Caldilineaceae bacterium]